MTARMRLIFGVLSFPFRLLAWVLRRLYVLTRGYNVLELHLHGRLSDRRPR